jgi:hypothetical protein
MAEWLTLMERYLDPALYDDRVKELTGHVVVARFLDSETTQTPSKFALHVGELRACMARKYEMEHPNEELPRQLAAGSYSTRWGDAFPSDVYKHQGKHRFGQRIGTAIKLDLTKRGYPDGWASVDMPSGAHVKEWLLDTIKVRVVQGCDPLIRPMHGELLYINSSDC